jgi:hypothetical protein
VALDRSLAGEQAIVADGCLKCAEQLCAAGKQAEALALYERLCKQDVPQTVRIAALRGTVLLRGTGRDAPVSQTTQQ